MGARISLPEMQGHGLRRRISFSARKRITKHNRVRDISSVASVPGTASVTQVTPAIQTSGTSANEPFGMSNAERSNLTQMTETMASVGRTAVAGMALENRFPLAPVPAGTGAVTSQEADRMSSQGVSPIATRQRARGRLQTWRSQMSRTFPPNLARLMLLSCAALWGGSYLVAKVAMTAITPQWLMAMRMAGACAILMALFHKSIIPALNRRIVVPAIMVGLTYYGTMVLQTTGLQSIDPGRSAFLTASYCVFTPFVTWIVSKTKPRAVNIVAGVICLTGVGFIALKPGSSTLALVPGDWMTLGCAVIFSFNLIYLGVYAKRFNPIAVTFVQFAVAGVLFLFGAVVSEPAPNASWLHPVVVWSFLYLVIGATTMAQIMQNIGLAHVPATSASIIMCTESLFSVGFSALFWGERIGWNSLAGFALIFSAVLMSVMKHRAPTRS